MAIKLSMKAQLISNDIREELQTVYCEYFNEMISLGFYPNVTLRRISITTLYYFFILLNKEK